MEVEALHHSRQIVTAQLVGGDALWPVMGILPAVIRVRFKCLPGVRWEPEPYAAICCGVKHMTVMLARVGAGSA